MKQLGDQVRVSINGQHTFFLNQAIMSRYSAKFKKMMMVKTNQENTLEIQEFPCGVDGFELITRFCYNNGKIQVTPSNVSVLHCSAIFLEIKTLVQKTETFLEGLFYWSWRDIILSLKSCEGDGDGDGEGEGLFSLAESTGLLDKLINSLLTKIDLNLVNLSPSSPASSSPDVTKSKAWWFDDMTILPPKIIHKVVNTMGCYGTENHSLILTKFLIHYLKRVSPKMKSSEYSGLADTAVHGVVVVGKSGFTCRGLFWVLRVVSGFGLSRECRIELERLIGGMLDKATLDDLLVCGHGGGVGAYDVNLVLRLVRVFVDCEEVPLQKMKKVGRLIDKYMGEISPDHNLKVSKFLAVAESLPDCARDYFDGVYRAIDIYLESHPMISSEERSALCRCLNYEKLTLEACKDLAKNPRIPPKISIQALVAQHSKDPKKAISSEYCSPFFSRLPSSPGAVDDDKLSEYSQGKEQMKLNLERMQYRVMELEKVCMDMKHQMSKMARDKVISLHSENRALPRLC